MIFETKIIIATLVSFVVTFVLIPRFIKIAYRFRLVDFPGKRASHKQGVPILGGIPIFIGVMIALIVFSNFFETFPFIISLVILFSVGLIDDLISLSPFSKLFFQILAIFALIYFSDLRIQSMYGVLGVHKLTIPASILFTTFVVVVIVNSFNLIDGVDGLAGMLGSISAFTFGVISYLMYQPQIAIFSFIISGSLLAFLLYNLHPAKLFMGDTGSLFIGMALSIMALNIIRNGLVVEGFRDLQLPNKGPLIAIALLAIPLFDSLRVFLYRFLNKRHPLHAGRDHFHHILLDLGYGHARTSFLILLLSIFSIFLAYNLLDVNINLSIFILALFNYIFIFIFSILRRRKRRRK